MINFAAILQFSEIESYLKIILGTKYKVEQMFTSWCSTSPLLTQ